MIPRNVDEYSQIDKAYYKTLVPSSTPLEKKKPQISKTSLFWDITRR
jgi:hypothetical protein